MAIEVVKDEGRWWLKGECVGRKVNVDTGMPATKEFLAAAELLKFQEEAAIYGLPGARRAPKVMKAATVKEGLRSYMMKLHGEGKLTLKLNSSLDLLERRLGPKTMLVNLDVEGYKAMRFGEGAAAGSVRRELNLVKAMLNHCKAVGLLFEVPKVVKPRVRDERTLALGSEKIDELLGWLAASWPIYAQVVTVLADTGARWSEAVELRWGDVEIEEVVEGSGSLFGGYVEVGGRGGSWTKSRRRRIPLTGWLWLMLKLLRDHVKPRDSDKVLVGGRGTGLDHADHEYLRVRLAEWGMENGAEGLRVHDLRHSFAVRAAQAGADVADLQGLLGHSQIKMTMRYRGFVPSRAEKAVRSMD